MADRDDAEQVEPAESTDPADGDDASPEHRFRPGSLILAAAGLGAIAVMLLLGGGGGDTPADSTEPEANVDDHGHDHGDEPLAEESATGQPTDSPSPAETDTGTQPPDSPPTETPIMPTPFATTPGSDGLHEDGPSPAGWQEVAEGFGRTFTNDELDHKAWFVAVSAWLTPDQAAKYENVSPTSIPEGELVDATVGDPNGRLYTEGELTYDTGLVINVALTYDDNSDSWLVSSVLPVEQTAAGPSSSGSSPPESVWSPFGREPHAPRSIPSL